MKTIAACALALTLATASTAVAKGLVDIHVHGNNLGRVQIHIHHVVSHVEVLNDGTLIFEILP